MNKRPLIRNRLSHGATHVAAGAHGFTLIEMMVAMLLGLIVIGGVISVFLAGQQTYRTNEALGDVENGSRTAFELLSRDLRDAGLSGCDNTNGRIANVVNNGASNWYSDWSNALHGYDDASQDPALSSLTGTGAPVPGTSSVHILSTATADVVVKRSASGGTGSPASLGINTPSSLLATGDLIIVCDYDHATILQITKYSGDNIVVHNAGNGDASPGNCTKGLGYPAPTPCNSSTNDSNGAVYDFANNGRIAILTAVDWYIGSNSVGTTSLYRLNVGYGAAPPTATPQEMVRNVTGMKILYLQPPGTQFDKAANMTNWATVNAAQVTLSLQSASQRVSSNNSARLTRSFTSTTTVRNRVQ
ncbi:prepilin-type N-terminal cleavage/methylation domain-containing protein [Dyella sp.]|uniref:prepilin-type N-terminal cleavage/methylation domain-containing protein n=1 Tax=Dyella sp. TaxID=1869338 RepID=UPI002D79C033|nr:prepilin-type N-terminal cleavage/methylation domain-containing protein [Dyella sp.]HET7329538.1 prepilin-type N-terminal cleavage/methylation domain-containing protein [Dyella sp.]